MRISSTSGTNKGLTLLSSKGEEPRESAGEFGVDERSLEETTEPPSGMCCSRTGAPGRSGDESLMKERMDHY